MFTLHAHGVGAGIAIGAARVLTGARIDARAIDEYAIEPHAVAAETARLHDAIARTVQSLGQLRAQLPRGAPEDVVALLSGHLLMLTDAQWREQPARIIDERRINAEAALARFADSLIRFFDGVTDPYLRAKAIDVAQVAARIQDELGGQPAGALRGIKADELTDKIVVADDLTPTDAIELKRRNIGAFITGLGGPISHTAILARSMKIPAIVGLGAIDSVRDGDVLIVDGKRGVVLVNPDDSAIAAYQRRREKIRRRIDDLDKLRFAEAETLDGARVSLQVNIELPDELEADIAHRDGGWAHGVGLYRTEFLFMNRAQPPDEQEQFEVYADIVRRARAPVTIRTLDLGGDKPADARGRGGAVNPALGRRAIRLCLNDLNLFKPQLKAIYRASMAGEVRLMAPMVSCMDELTQLFALLDQVKRELRQAGHQFNPNTPVGAMIEVPAAAIAADLFAAKLDFLSIGTNDLIQYTLAIDRIDDQVNYLYDPLHPAVLRLIKTIITAAKTADIPVSMCGEMAGDPTYTRILLALGLREFSMEPASLAEVKRQIRLTDLGRLYPRMDRLMQCAAPAQMRGLVAEMNQ